MGCSASKEEGNVQTGGVVSKSGGMAMGSKATGMEMSKMGGPDGFKYYYFDIHGRGEAGRMLLAHAKVKYEDVRVQGADWPTVKATLPGG